MERKLNEKFPIINQIFLYGVIGAISAGIDTLCFLFLRHFGLELYLSNFIGINLGIALSFFLNTYYNFKKTDMLVKRALSFFCIGYMGLALSMVIMYIGTNLFKIQESIVKLSSILIVAAFQFVLNKLITYRKRRLSVNNF